MGQIEMYISVMLCFPSSVECQRHFVTKSDIFPPVIHHSREWGGWGSNREEREKKGERWGRERNGGGRIVLVRPRGLTVSPNKSKVMIFPQKSQSSGDMRYVFNLGDTALDHTFFCDSRGFALAVGARRALYSVKQKSFVKDLWQSNPAHCAVR